MSRQSYVQETRSEVSDYEAKKKIEITKVFLNSVFTTTHIANLAKKKSLIDEKQYIAEILKLKFESPKDQILIDFYNSNYKFCIKNKFTLEKSSTFLSIMFFMFNYSVMNKKLTKDKSYNMFLEIMEFHSIHRPPYSYEIFSGEDKSSIIDFAKKTFYHNFSMIENIFKYNMNIVLNSTDHKDIPKIDLPKIEALQDEFLIDEKECSIIQNYFLKADVRKENIKKDEDDKKHKSDIEVYEEMEMDKLKTFVNSFYRPKNNTENERLSIDNLNNAKAQVEFELKEAKNVLNEKTSEIIRETQDRFVLANKELNEKIDTLVAQTVKK